VDEYRFGPFRLDVAKRVLWQGDDIVGLQPKALDLLLVLVEAGGDVVTKDQLMQRVWPDTFVEEANLSVNVSALRRALGEQADGRPYIQTVPRRGYRFLAAARDRPPAPAPDTRPALAVLPFRVLGGALDDTFGLAMADALITRLSGERVRVRPTSSVLRYVGATVDAQQAGRELSVEACLEGVLQRDGARLRVTVQCVPLVSRPQPGSVALGAWAERFECDYAGVFAAQDEVAERVARAFAARIGTAAADTPRPRATRDPEAYRAYLRGRHFWSRFTPENLERAFGCFQEAVALDPDYAAPHAGLADAYVVLGLSGVVPARDAWPLARAAADQALGRDGHLAEAHVSRAFVALFEDWDWSRAGELLERACRLQPDAAASHQWYGLYHLLLGNLEEAALALRRAEELEPLSLVVSTLQGFRLGLERDFEAEEARQRRTLELDPHQLLGHWGHGLALAHLGQHAQAAQAHRRALELAGGHGFLGAVLARTLALAGEPELARAQLAQAGASSYLCAPAYLALGDPEAALRALERALHERDPWLVLLAIDPPLDELRGLPRFDALMRQVGAQTSGRARTRP
jgi:DNA-binding winged helix-turn-helix (wHTH) protein/tetratricopeptide (TPR) repeat protein